MFIYLALRNKVSYLLRMPPTKNNSERIYSLQRKLASFQDENQGLAPNLQRGIQIYDKENTRHSLYNRDNPKNLFLISETLEALIPINRTHWKVDNFWHRLFAIICAPCALLCALFIPTVNQAKDKHGWIKLLNCFHIISSPILTVILFEALLISNPSQIQLSFIKYMYTLIVSIPLSIFVFFTSRTDQPPVYYKVNIYINTTYIYFILFTDHHLPVHSSLLC